MEGNILEICKKIREDCKKEKEKIIEEAENARVSILEDAKKIAKEKEVSLLEEFEKKSIILKEKFYSSVNLEKRRIILNEKNRFIEMVISKVEEKKDKFRKDKNYINFLKGAILEGLDILDYNDVVVEYSFLDEDLIKDIIEEIKNKRDINLYFKKAQFTDLGVILYSKDGHLMYDNTFKARMRRLYEKIYFSLLKELS